MNQPSAGLANYMVLVESVVPVICAAKKIEDPDPVVKSFLEPALDTFQNVSFIISVSNSSGFDHLMIPDHFHRFVFPRSLLLGGRRGIS